MSWMRRTSEAVHVYHANEQGRIDAYAPGL